MDDMEAHHKYESHNLCKEYCPLESLLNHFQSKSPCNQLYLV